MLIAAVALVTGLIGQDADWMTLFNGRDLTGWTPKIKGYELGENFGNTFRVVDGRLVVSYDQYGGEFKERFGHLFYQSEYDRYVLQLEYRFVGEQIADGPGWAFKNSGVMIHGQSAKSMGLDQSFPVSSEVQLLGGGPEGDRPTGNLCTPGTNIVMDDKLVTQHCLNSSSPTFRGEEWVKLEIEVHGSEDVIHRINGEEVFRYAKVQYDPNDADAQRLIDGNDLLISGGTISLQSESHPVEFRGIRLRLLD